MELQIDFNITSNLNDRLAYNPAMVKAVEMAVKQFTACNWGIIPEEDKEANNSDLQARDGHVLGKYETPEGNIYINMEFWPDNKNKALIMFCDEY